MKLNIYIAGPITGVPDYKVRFSEAVKKVRGAFKDCVIYKPARLPGGHTESWYMKQAIKMMFGANVIAFMQGWQHSAGCRVERALAEKLNKTIFEIT